MARALRRPLLPLAALLLVAATPRVQREGVSFEPPTGFVPLELGARASGALVPAVDADARRRSLAVLDAELHDATLSIGLVEAPLPEGPSARDELASAVAAHVGDELGLGWRLASVTRGRPPDVGFEVAGRAEAPDLARELGFVFVPLGEVTVVLALSAPPDGLAAHLPALRAAARTLRYEPPAPGATGWPRAAVAVSAVVVLALAASGALLVRRRATG